MTDPLLVQIRERLGERERHKKAILEQGMNFVQSGADRDLELALEVVERLWVRLLNLEQRS